MESLLIARDKPIINKTDSSLLLELFKYNISGYHMMSYTSYDVRLSDCAGAIAVCSIFTICYEFCILSKTQCKSIYYHFMRDHESSNFQKPARNKRICGETYDF